LKKERYFEGDSLEQLLNALSISIKKIIQSRNVLMLTTYNRRDELLSLILPFPEVYMYPGIYPTSIDSYFIWKLTTSDHTAIYLLPHLGFDSIIK
jgi:hypothetical protein